MIKILKATLMSLGLLLGLSSIAKAEDSLWGNEVRLGVLQHDVTSQLGHRFERGQDFNIEGLFKSPDVLSVFFSPRPHLGASLNFQGATSQFYAGLTWHCDLPFAAFLEFSLGGEGHNGKTKGKPTKKVDKKTNLGSRLLFRESVSLGVAFIEKHCLSLMLDHASHAGLAKPNPGLTSLGVRYGYRF